MAHRLARAEEPLLWAIAAAAFVAIFAFDAPFPAIVLAAALIGYFGGRVAPADVHARRRPRRAHEASYGPALIDDDTPTPAHARFSLAATWSTVLGVGLGLWALAMAALVAALRLARAR